MRIVSLAPANTEILFALGAGPEVVAVTRFCDWPLEAKERQVFGSWVVSEEDKLRALGPDVILTSQWMPELLKTWDGPGKVVHVAPNNLWDVLESIRTIGAAVGRPREAGETVRTMEQAFEEIRAHAPERRPHAYMEEWFDPPTAAGNWVPELVAIAGGEEVLLEVNQPSKTFPLAALTVANPDIVVCHWSGWGERVEPVRIYERPGWQEVRAVAEERVHFVNDALINRPGPRLVEGARMLQHLFRELDA